ncbi:hypothetical protein EV1_010608 [Malus domestica]
MQKEGAKRKASRKPTRPLRKRIKASKPKLEREHLVEEPRKLKDLWKAVFPVGKGWDRMNSVHKEFNWDFFNLERAFEEKGKLNHEVIGNKDKVYLFGTIECHFQRKNEFVVPVLMITRRKKMAARVGGEEDEFAKFIIEETIGGDEGLSPVVKAGLKEYVEDMLFDAKRNHGENKDSCSSVFSFIQAILGEGRCKCKYSDEGTNTLKRLSREERFGEQTL